MEDPDELWAEVLIVKANIPMLLGNNIMKPLGAEIMLCPGGYGYLKLKALKIDLKETTGGHFVMKVSDLSKLTGLYPCEDCERTFHNIKDLKSHFERVHYKQMDNGCNMCQDTYYGKNVLQCHVDGAHDKEKRILSALKHPSMKKETTGCIMKVITDLNTQYNGASSDKERKLIKAIKTVAQCTKDEFKHQCEICGFDASNKDNVKDHVDAIHGQEIESNEIEIIFLSQHMEENVEDEVDVSWDILLVKDVDAGLTKDEQAEVLKLHKYFAH